MTDEQLPPSALICAFNYEGVSCPNYTDGTHVFCPPHTARLAEEVRLGVHQIIEDELGVDAHQITPNARFIDDLGADSLDTPELIIRLEETFVIDVPNQIAQQIQSVRDTISHVIDLLSKEKKFYFFDKASFVPHEHSEEQKDRIAQRRLEATAGRELFQDYFRDLGLDALEVGKLFKTVMRDNRVYHVTTAPKSEGEGEAERVVMVDVFFLSENRLNYFKLKPDSVMFQSITLNELRLAYKTEFGSDGKICKITVWSERRGETADEGDDGEKSIYDEKFEFEKAAGVEGALAFLRKYISNLEIGR